MPLEGSRGVAASSKHIVGTIAWTVNKLPKTIFSLFILCIKNVAEVIVWTTDSNEYSAIVNFYIGPGVF